MGLSQRDIMRPYVDKNITEAEITDVMESNRYTRTQAITAIIRFLLKYAILSHRWFREGEPTYGDVMRGAAWEGPGYEKLRRFCEKAHQYGCVLAWSDTCCIDKSSSVELDEAIRSMFRWYRDAHVCIVFLAGVSRLEDIHRDEWFGRGWALQELLAPRIMKFYGSNWEALGGAVNDKEDDGVLGVVSQTTNIPMQDLKAFVPGTTRVQEKMVWASKRRTTRMEDTAYCLVGLFDISMQIAYGEGDWAFHRLMENHPAAM
ncbi:hypothetical protein BU15DRAFT_90692 [Melanogaster broomeanus]|nr:hypothetical protein BU15DRAFT_90692 [Melanogaster broomeanus]